MKKVLLGTTAFVAAGALAGEAAAKLDMRLGGYFEAILFGVSEKTGAREPGENRKGYDFKREAEIFFLGEATLDNGLKVGVNVQLEAETCGDQIDESYLYFQGNWGKLNLGSENSAHYLMTYGHHTVWSSIDGQDINFAPLYQLGGNLAGGGSGLGGAGAAYAPLLTGDEEKLTYFTPRFNGFQFGISWTPENSSGSGCCGGASADKANTAGAPLDNEIGEQSNAIEIGLNYEGMIGSANFAAGGGYGVGFIEKRSSLATGGGPVSITRGGLVAAPGGKDRHQFSGGFLVGYQGWQFGAGGLYDNNGVSSGWEEYTWAVGGGYGTGPWAASLSYIDRTQKMDHSSGIDDDEHKSGTIAARYTFGPGMVVNAAAQYFYLTGEDSAQKNQGFTGTVGTRISF